MKKLGVVITAIVCIALVCGGFWYVSQRNQPSHESGEELTETQKVITKDISSNYPKTPREVVKFYNRIIKCYYSGKCTDEELDKLADQALILFDQELLANNPKETYLSSIKSEIASYKSASKTISRTGVCDSNDVKYITDKDDSLAYVKASYFINVDKQFSKTFQEYVLRKDADGRWKILCFYKTEGDASEDGGN